MHAHSQTRVRIYKDGAKSEWNGNHVIRFLRDALALLSPGVRLERVPVFCAPLLLVSSSVLRLFFHVICSLQLLNTRLTVNH